MKTLLLFLLLSLPIFAQVNGITYGSGNILSDSIYYGGTTTGDSVKIYDFRYSNDWFMLFLEGDSNSPVDSIIVRKGTFRFNNAGAIVDTVWGAQINWKDSTWSNVNTLINNTTGVHYLLFDPIVGLVKMEIINHWSTNKTRKIKYVWNYLRIR